MQENFFDAAIRNWQDAYILEKADEYDNAVCLHGFAAECSLKAILQEGISRDVVIKYGHNIDLLLNDILSFSENDIKIASILDPSLGLRLSGIRLEDILFRITLKGDIMRMGIIMEMMLLNAEKMLWHM